MADTPRILEPHATLRDDDPDVGLFTVLREDGSTDPAADAKAVGPDRETLLRGYRHMRRLRHLDARMILLQRQGRIGFYGACTGQEATPIATGLVAQEKDWVFPALREQSVMLVRGFPLHEFVGQVFGNSADNLKGRQMPSHQSGRRVNQVSWSSCIGPQIPQAVGCAMAMKTKKTGAIAFGFCGDGATSQPDFHAAMTFAARFKAPAVLVCQNNHWSISVPTAKQTSSKTICVKARAYGMPGMRVDGNDVLAMYKALSIAAARARSGEGPTFIEAVTYRIGAHSTSDDPTRYRADSEVEAWKKKDPVERLARHLRFVGAIDDAYEAELETELTAEVAAAIKTVEEMPPPERTSLFADVYSEPPWHLKEQEALLRTMPPAPSH